jgi:UDP-N-acetylglucosamine transferase subunit ALG13
MTTFVTVGNMHQPFRRLLDAVEAAAHALPPPIVVQSGHTPFASSRMQVVPFMPMDDFSRQVDGADILVMHGGAGSIIHAAAAGRRPLVMARRFDLGEALDDHQVQFAEAMEAAGRIARIEDGGSLERALLRGPFTTDASTPAPMLELVRAALQRHMRGT